MNLIAILIGTLIAGVGSVWIAATLSFGVLARYTQHMLSLAAGALLATAFIRLLPEGLESGVAVHVLSATLLAGLLFFFCSTRPSCGTTAMSITPACPRWTRPWSTPT
jgi:zinc and cadmium transporter